MIESDAVRKALFPRPRYTPEEHRRVFAVAHARLARYLRAGRSVVFDATNLEEASRRALLRIAAACGARVLVAHLVVPDYVARQRLDRRGMARARRDLSDADWAVYQAMAPRFEPIRGPHWVLNGTADPDALAALLARRLSEEALAAEVAPPRPDAPTEEENT